MSKDIQIFATSQRDKERIEIDDLYFFEEQGIHDWRGEGHYEMFDLEVYVDGKQVYPHKAKKLLLKCLAYFDDLPTGDPIQNKLIDHINEFLNKE